MTRTKCNQEGCNNNCNGVYCYIHNPILKPHNCITPGCDRTTRKTYCKQHCKSYNICKYPLCGNTCVNEYCKNHKPETMERKRLYTRAYIKSHKIRTEPLEEILT